MTPSIRATVRFIREKGGTVERLLPIRVTDVPRPYTLNQYRVTLPGIPSVVIDEVLMRMLSSNEGRDIFRIVKQAGRLTTCHA